MRNYLKGEIPWEEVKSTMMTEKAPKKDRPARRRKGPLELNRRDNRATRKFKRYKELQQDIVKSRKETIERIVEGNEKDNNVEVPNIAEIENVYVGRLETNKKMDTIVPEPNPLTFSDEVYRPIDINEVDKALRKCKTSTAAGPDKLTVPDLKKIGLNHLTAIFNKWWADEIPTAEKRSRTILLHKGGNRREVGNWRPITIGNILHRVYAKLWDMRLRRKVTVNKRQKAFVPLDGTFDNVNLLQSEI